MRIAEAVLAVIFVSILLFVAYGNYESDKAVKSWKLAAEQWEQVYSECAKTAKGCVATLDQAGRALDRCEAVLGDEADIRGR